jgi:hypothetical protein
MVYENKDRFHWPPTPSTPIEAPWRELEEAIRALYRVAKKLDTLISLWGGLPTPPEGAPGAPVTPVIVPNKNTWRHGQKIVTTAGTPVQLPDLEIPDGYAVTVIAKTGNSGYIYLGKSQADCANSVLRFDGLSAGLAHSLKVKNLKEIWVDANVDGEGVSWSVEYDS